MLAHALADATQTTYQFSFFQPLGAGLLSGTVISAVLGLLFRKRVVSMEERIKSEIRVQYEQSLAEFQSTRSWKERSVAELLGPLYMNFDRTSRAFARWQAGNLFLEAKVIREGNVTIRDLLLSKSNLIPEQLRDDAGHLIEHYDRWLEEFERVRAAEKPDLTTPFVFVGTKGFPFPGAAEQRFRAAFQEMWRDLYFRGGAINESQSAKANESSRLQPFGQPPGS